jgi:uncharacterized protein
VSVPVAMNEAVHAFVLRPLEALGDLVVVFSHGFTVDGTESGRHFLALAESLVEQGHSAVLFDYRGSGYSDRAFEEMTLDTEIADLGAVLDFVGEQFGGLRRAVWGESFGAAVTAHTLANRSDISFAVMWSLSADLHRRYQNRFGPEIETSGYVYTNGFKVRLSFLESLDGRDTFTAIDQMRIPCLLVHGDADNVASIELSRTAHRISPDRTTLVEIKGGNHGFESQPAQFDQASDATFEWIRERLS